MLDEVYGIPVRRCVQEPFRLTPSKAMSINAGRSPGLWSRLPKSLPMACDSHSGSSISDAPLTVAGQLPICFMRMKRHGIPFSWRPKRHTDIVIERTSDKCIKIHLCAFASWREKKESRKVAKMRNKRDLLSLQLPARSTARRSVLPQTLYELQPESLRMPRT